MSVTDHILSALTTVIRMNDKVEEMAGLMKEQQRRIDDLHSRVIRVDRLAGFGSEFADHPAPCIQIPRGRQAPARGVAVCCAPGGFEGVCGDVGGGVMCDLLPVQVQ
ncbi:MAG: hypothetical protein VKK99_02330 [Cyanobacteriota bacterium]|nr:hypothetical protein [Cyanobacteriota bacterium]